jgi:hypothetical protein
MTPTGKSYYTFDDGAIVEYETNYTTCHDIETNQRLPLTIQTISDHNKRKMCILAILIILVFVIYGLCHL